VRMTARTCARKQKQPNILIIASLLTLGRAAVRHL
jgi:hypothetical protein